MSDLLLKGGQVIDPSQDLRDRLDIAIKDGIISHVAPSINSEEISQVIDVSDKLVIPGLIDLHCHIYEGVNQTGLNPDLIGVRSGVTTLVDGGSAGCYTFGGFPTHVVPQAKTGVFCMLNIGRTGLSFMPELSRREDIDFEETVKVIQANKPLIQGVKLRAVGPAVATMGIEIMHLAKQAAREGNVRLMVHIGDPEAKDGPTLTRQLIPLLDSGDILTHLFTGNPGHILDNDGKVVPELMDAQEHGIFLDTAHGRLNFSFDVAKRALDQGVRPQSISTDLNILGRQMIVHSLVEMMARFLALGFDLDDVIRMTTVNPAKALYMEDVLGSLAVGRRADITVLREVSGNWVFRDSVGGTLTGTKALVPTVTVKSGEIFSPDWGPHPWGWLPETTP